MPGLISLRAPAFWWKKPGLPAALLSPLGAIYGAVAAHRMKRDGHRAGVPVICIGNPTLGGAGKTPMALAIAKLLKERGRKPFFLSRGYGGLARGPLRVDMAKHTARDIGDEALLLAAEAPTIVGGDRAASAKLAEASGADVLVMDDGFQNPSLEKDLSILVVDGMRGIGNGYVFPAGPLRAPLAAQLSRAQAMLVVGSDAENAALTEAARAPLVSLRGRIAPNLEALLPLRGKPLLAFAGIGFPEKFFTTLELGGLNAAARRAFPDHHYYSAGDAAKLLSDAASSGQTLVTTAKDHARMTGNPALAELRKQAMPLPVQMMFEKPEEIGKLIGAALARR
jgi:tetraacyldisaccharide 4'-kinase